MIIAYILAVSLTLSGGLLGADPDFNLEDFKWKKRVILLFFPSEQDPQVLQQLETLDQDIEGFSVRDLLLVSLPADGLGRAGALELESSTTARLYGEFKVTPCQFRFLVIGKDGTKKLDRSSPVGLDQLFRLIDSMPMRQREMRENGG